VIFDRRAATTVVLPFADAPTGICRWCGSAVSGRRKTWCSDACVDTWRAHSDPDTMRRNAFEGAEGRCAVCCFDLGAAERRFRFLVAHVAAEQVQIEWAMFMAPRGFGAEFAPRARLWEADHITPLVEGGAHHPDNLRLLCVPCHRTETAALARRRAERRRTEAA
jgi:hypothetical protein